MIGWTHTQDSAGYDIIGSSQLVLHVAPQSLPSPHAMPLDTLNQSLRERYFGGNDRRHSVYNDEISITTSAGKPLLTMRRWAIFPNHSDALAASAQDGQ